MYSNIGSDLILKTLRLPLTRKGAAKPVVAEQQIVHWLDMYLRNSNRSVRWQQRDAPAAFSHEKQNKFTKPGRGHLKDCFDQAQAQA
ncbi:hypothetical protein NDU88_006011 [Pleurodeles waltl]|uniref:Uncharacterized protein n=1 Tax=Pleurodeles waltl TaxID=8319 RepID=A0AAV7X097_PLEWA|nr:hypothetical protein NDU88_006011 [Pleurodeles waltl]